MTRVPVLSPVECDEQLARLSERERQSFERQVQISEAKLGSGPGDRWRRIACLLMSLTPAPAKLSGSNTILFYIPDGKYRKQVFALHAKADGTLIVCLNNVLEEAMKRRLLKRKREDQGSTYQLGAGADFLTIECCDGKTPSPEAYYKDMTGWNRRAICIALPMDASEEQVAATEQLCVLSARA